MTEGSWLGIKRRLSDKRASSEMKRERLRLLISMFNIQIGCDVVIQSYRSAAKCCDTLAVFSCRKLRKAVGADTWTGVIF